MPNAGISETSQISSGNASDAIASNRPVIHLNCMDPNWKEHCRTHLKALEEIEVTDFNADADRDWAHCLARKYGAKCQVRKRIGRVIFTFARPIPLTFS